MYVLCYRIVIVCVCLFVSFFCVHISCYSGMHYLTRWYLQQKSIFVEQVYITCLPCIAEKIMVIYVFITSKKTHGDCEWEGLGLGLGLCKTYSQVVHLLFCSLSFVGSHNVHKPDLILCALSVGLPPPSHSAAVSWRPLHGGWVCAHLPGGLLR